MLAKQAEIGGAVKNEIKATKQHSSLDLSCLKYFRT